MTPWRTAGEISLGELVAASASRWRLLFGLPLLASVLTVLVSLAIRPTFTAVTAFVPEEAAQGTIPSSLAGLASQFGVQIGTDGTQSGSFYAAVLRSREITDKVLLTEFVAPHTAQVAGDSATLLQLLAVEGDSLADSLHNGRKKMEDLVAVSVDKITGIVTLAVDSRYPQVAAAVANRYVNALNEFNTKTRQSQARERRRFVEDRMAAADTELQAAEEAIKQFYERNRTWQQSPELSFTHERLQRRVAIREEVSLTLRREYETARIGEVNDTPVITVIYSAVPPQEKSKPRRVLLAGLSFVLGGFVSTLVILISAAARGSPGPTTQPTQEAS